MAETAMGGCGCLRNDAAVGETIASHRFVVAFLRLRPVLIRASRVLPSTPPLFHSIDRQSFCGQFLGCSLSGIHRCPQTSHSATSIVFHAMPPLYRILPKGHNNP
jgi:hypothetical protein